MCCIKEHTDIRCACFWTIPFLCDLQLSQQGQSPRRRRRSQREPGQAMVDPATAGLCIGTLIIGVLIGALLGRWSRGRTLHQLEQRNLDRQLDVITNCLCDTADAANGRLQFPLVVVRAQDFIIAGRIIRYEDLRRSSKHIVIDSTEQLKAFERKARLVFFSQCGVVVSILQRPEPLAVPRFPNGCADRIASFQSMDSVPQPRSDQRAVPLHGRGSAAPPVCPRLVA